MHVRITTDLPLGFRTDDARVAIAFQGPTTNATPPLPVRLVPTTLPVRVSGTAKRLGQPRSPALVTAHDRVAGDPTRIPFDCLAANNALRLDLPTLPPRISTSSHVRKCPPGFALHALGTVQPVLFRRIVLELTAAENALGGLFLRSIVRIRRRFERDRFSTTVLGTVLLLVSTVELPPASRTLPVRQTFAVRTSVMNAETTSTVEFRRTGRTRIRSHIPTTFAFAYE